MTILHYIPTIDRKDGGVSSFMQLLAKSLGELVNLHIVTHKGENDLKIENAVVHYIPSGLMNYWEVKNKFEDILDEIKPNLFHTNCCWYPYAAYSIIWAKDKGYKVVLSPHGMLEPWILKRHYLTRKLPGLLLYQRRAIKKADMLHATADSEKDNLYKLGYNFNISVIPNCINVKDIRIKNDWKKEKKILFLSRIHVKKGINYLIEAAAKLRYSLQGFTIQIVGSGDKSYVSELKQMVSDLNLDDMIQFVGPVFGDNKFELYRNADLFVLPTHSENFGIVVAEALACGTPVITTNGTPWQELETEHCGWWTEIGTEPLANALRDFLKKSDGELETMGRNGRELVERKYSTNVVAEQFVDMYNKLLE